jgi:uncharacterized protein YcfL
MRAAFWARSGGGLLAGCGSHPEIPVSDQQALVMESNVLAAGISASACRRGDRDSGYRLLSCIMNASSRSPCIIVFLV